MSAGRWRACLLVGLSLAAGRAVFAQQAPEAAVTSVATAGTTGTSLVPAGSDFQGTDGGTSGQRAWTLTPNFSIDFTHTDNATLQPSGGHSDLITRTSPGLLLQGQSARASAYVDLKLQQINYMQTEGRDRVQRALNGTGKIELLENWLYLDLSARISRQATSAFGVPASGSDSVNSNVIETRTYTVAPYIKGRLLGAADYQLRFDNTQYSTKSGPMHDTTVQTVQGSLSGSTPLSRLGWSVDGSTQQLDYSTGAQNKTDSLRGSLSYSLDPQLRFTLIHGQESNDYLNFQQQTTSINGWGFEWAPSERTQLTWRQEKRYFGNGYNLNFTHRTPHTAWRVSGSRDVAIRSPQGMTFAMGTYFDLLNEQLRSTIPDDTERFAAILALLDQMNISPDAQVVGGFMSSRASINRTREISAVWNGVRNIITVSAQDLDRTMLGSGIGIPVDDFSTFSSSIRQRGLNLSWAHKLTPTATLTVVGTRSTTTGTTSSLKTDRTMYTATVSRKLGAFTSGSLGLRRTNVSGFVDYVENAVILSLIAKF